jgi:protein-S-isoprenylcysteine O-methyltransferase Ste14
MVTLKPVQKLLAIFSSLISRSSFGTDFILRMPLAVYFALSLVGSGQAILLFVAQWSSPDVPFKALKFAGLLSKLLFLFTLFLLTVMRSKPIRSSVSWPARLVAFIGCFLPLSLVWLPEAELPPALTVISITATVCGCALAIWTACWLGRSFSVAPQARELVTGGPYAFVRHPLYLCEEVAVLGAMLACFSPVAVAIAGIHWVFQLKRMEYEERILRATFPEYAKFAATVPRLIPLRIWNSASARRRD